MDDSRNAATSGSTLEGLAPQPRYIEHITFEGRDCVILSPEEYEALWEIANKAARSEKVAPVDHIPNAEFCPHCNPCRNGDRLAKAERFNEDHDAVLRGLASYLGAGGFNSLGLIDPEIADQKIRWGIDHIVAAETHRYIQECARLICPRCRELPTEFPWPEYQHDPEPTYWHEAERCKASAIWLLVRNIKTPAAQATVEAHPTCTGANEPAVAGPSTVPPVVTDSEREGRGFTVFMNAGPQGVEGAPGNGDYGQTGSGLAEPAPPYGPEDSYNGGHGPLYDDTKQASAPSAIAAPVNEQEPVAWRWKDKFDRSEHWHHGPHAPIGDNGHDIEPLYGHPWLQSASIHAPAGKTPRTDALLREITVWKDSIYCGRFLDEHVLAEESTRLATTAAPAGETPRTDHAAWRSRYADHVPTKLAGEIESELTKAQANAEAFEQELKDGDRLCEAFGVSRTESGWLNVPKMVGILNDLREQAARSASVVPAPAGETPRTDGLGSGELFTNEENCNPPQMLKRLVAAMTLARQLERELATAKAELWATRELYAKESSARSASVPLAEVQEVYDMVGANIRAVEPLLKPYEQPWDDVDHRRQERYNVWMCVHSALKRIVHRLDSRASSDSEAKHD